MTAITIAANGSASAVTQAKYGNLTTIACVARLRASDLLAVADGTTLASLVRFAGKNSLTLGVSRTGAELYVFGRDSVEGAFAIATVQRSAIPTNGWVNAYLVRRSGTGVTGEIAVYAGTTLLAGATTSTALGALPTGAAAGALALGGSIPMTFDALHIFNRALTVVERTTQPTLSLSGLIGGYVFTEGIGVASADQVSGGSALSLSGASWVSGGDWNGAVNAVWLGNPAGLPNANQQPIDWSLQLARRNGSGVIPRNSVYLDAVSGAAVLSLGIGAQDYSESGPSFSYADANGDVFFCWNEQGTGYVIDRLTWNQTTPTVSRVGTLPVQPALDTAHAFSNNPSTPYFLYVGIGTGSGGQFAINRIDVRTCTLANSGNFPKSLGVPPGSSAFAWLTVGGANDARFAFQRAGAESGGFWNVGTDTVVIRDKAWFEQPLPLGTRFDELHISDDGRYAAVLCGIAPGSGLPSEPMAWWDLDTGYLSGNVLPLGFQLSHVAWQAGKLHAQNPAGNVLSMASATPSPVTVMGQAGWPAPTEWRNTSATSIAFQHTSGHFDMRSGGPAAQYVVGADYPDAVSPGAWLSIGGGVWEATLDLAPYLRYQLGICQVVQISQGATPSVIQTLVRASGATPSLNQYSINPVSGTEQVVRVRINGDGNPTGLVHAFASRLNNFAICAARVDGSDARIIAQHFSYPLADSDQYTDLPKPQIQRNGLWCAWNSNLGVWNGPRHVLVACLPRIAS